MTASLLLISVFCCVGVAALCVIAINGIRHADAVERLVDGLGTISSVEQDGGPTSAARGVGGGGRR